MKVEKKSGVFIVKQFNAEQSPRMLIEGVVATANPAASGFVLRSVNLQRALGRLGFDARAASVETPAGVCDSVCDGILCDGILCDAVCDAITCDNNVCDSICGGVCDQVCDQIQ